MGFRGYAIQLLDDAFLPHAEALKAIKTIIRLQWAVALHNRLTTYPCNCDCS